ncbi:MAG: hypothetical protein HYY17_04910 [Planctomycetes bacterium]|nr:hypothetical protein [Planctomycetota bacterium]
MNTNSAAAKPSTSPASFGSACASCASLVWQRVHGVPLFLDEGRGGPDGPAWSGGAGVYDVATCSRCGRKHTHLHTYGAEL